MLVCVYVCMCVRMSVYNTEVYVHHLSNFVIKGDRINKGAPTHFLLYVNKLVLKSRFRDGYDGKPLFSAPPQRGPLRGGNYPAQLYPRGQNRTLFGESELLLHSGVDEH